MTTLRTQPLLRSLLGARLRRERQAQQRTLRDVSKAARVSLGYLSEVERGQKEASSELLSSICAALTLRLSDVLRGVGDDLDRLAVVEQLPRRDATASPVNRAA
ncbi:MAG TPA: helix-turn-helix transcriptional regulator [Mycobacteriales bacterium]|nr:helix-turn-helix transcriptional regulator [Mycobacteriales bacterium]